MSEQRNIEACAETLYELFATKVSGHLPDWNGLDDKAKGAWRLYAKLVADALSEIVLTDENRK